MECRELEGSKTPSFVEADGEWLGTLPVRMEVVPEALTVLVPQKSEGAQRKCRRSMIVGGGGKRPGTVEFR